MRRQPDHRDAGILAARHLRRAGMVLLAGDRDPVVPVADDRLDNPDLLARSVEHVALLDMSFEIADIAPGIELLARPAGEPGFGERGAQRDAIAAAAGLDLAFGERAGEGAAAEHVAEMAFLVGPGDRLDSEPVERRIGGEGPRQLKRVDDAERAVEPAPAGLRLAMRADEEPPRGMRVTANDIADAVDDRVETGRGELLGEPVTRGDILLRIGRPVHAGLVAAKIGEPLQIREDPFTIGLRHSCAPSCQTCQRFNPPPAAPAGSLALSSAYCREGLQQENSR